MATSDRSITRRGLIGGGSAATVGLLLEHPDVSQAAKRRRPRPPRRRQADVLVVGAGAAGMAAAHAVAKAGRSVIVIEARERVGGRVENHDLSGGEIVEVGGTFVGPTQDRMYALLREVGLGTWPTYDEGQTNLLLEGKTTRVSNTDQSTYVGALGLVGGLEVLNVFPQIDQMAREVPVGAPWTAGRAQEWDGKTVETFKNEHFQSAESRSLFDAFLRILHGAGPNEVSLLFLLSYVAAAGNETTPGTLNSLIGTTGGAQQDRIVGGSQRLFVEIARSLGSRNVVLSSPARRISQDGSQVTVTTDRASFVGKQVVVAVPPALCQRIEYEPLLPAVRDQLTQRFPMGSYAKVEVFYPQPFWRDEGLNGQVVGEGVIGCSWDSSPPDGRPGVMACFIGGDRHRAWNRQNLPTRRKLIVDELVRYFGPRAAKPIDYFEKRWTGAEMWSRGGPTGFAAPGVLTGFGEQLQAPFGRIKWASTESSDYWIGYMEGAVRAGQRAARQVLADL